MNDGYLLDTNVLSEPLLPEPNKKLLQRIRRYQERIFTSSVVWHELRYGAQRLPKSKRRDVIETYLDTVVVATVPILAYDERAAAWHAAERARLEKKGKTPAFADGQIAATASVNGLTLVTNNVRHFTMFDGLKVESWYR